jgi:hypothetical protein
MPMPRLPLRLLVLALAALAVGVGAPSGAEAKECGKEIIDQYFSTGRITYHAQACYASALRQIDPDARMYSGIVAAIRASRARDAAADRRREREQAAGDATGGDAGAVDEPPAAEDPEPTFVEPAPEPVPQGEEVAPLAEPEQDALIEEVRALDLEPGATTAQALADVPATAAEHVPLPVVLLGSLATLLTLVGVGGLVVRRLDRSA